MKEFLSNPVVHGVIVFALAFLAVKLFSKADHRIEARRRKAIDLASALKAKGMTWVPDLLVSYAVGDYEDIAIKLGHVGVAIAHDPNMKAEFDSVFHKLLASKFQDPAAKDELETMLEGMGHKLTPIPAAPSQPDLLDAIHAKITAAVETAVANAMPAAPSTDTSAPADTKKQPTT